MILNKEINYRSFYPQTDLYFNFDISNYNSQTFEVGLSGEGSFFFSFESGFIKSPDSKIIGSFYKEPISIKGYVKKTNGISNLNYYLNGTPIDRNVPLNGLVNMSTIAVKIKDDTGIYSSQPGQFKYINLQSDIQGLNTPQFVFSDFKVTEQGLSGKLSGVKENNYPTRIFSMTSQSVTGNWEFIKRIYPGDVSSFYNRDIKSLIGGTIVILDLDTDAGFQSYNLVTTIDADTGGVINVPDPIILENQLARFSSYSGEILENQVSEKIYQIDYNIGENHRVDFEFDYYTGKYGSISINESLNKSIILSGTLPVENGLCKGYLFNSDFITQIDYTESDPNSSIYPFNGFIDFSVEDEISGYFENLNPVGYASITQNIIPSFSQINDLELYPSIAIDLGGTSGTISAGVLSPATRVYSLINQYNGQSVSVGNTSEIFSGFVTENDGGKFDFKKESFFRSGIILETQANFEFILAEDYLYPYRGIGLASLSKSMILTADAGQDGNKYWAIADKSNPLFVFKNLNPLIIQSGSYEVASGTLISGFLLRENDSFYYGAAGGPWNTENNTSSVSVVNETSRNFCNRLINRFASFYATLNPFKYLNPSMGIYKSLIANSNKEKIGDINLNDANFLMNPFRNKNENNTNVELKNLVYKSTFPHVCYSFDDPIFLYSEYVNDGTQSNANPNATNLFPDFIPYADNVGIISPIPFAYQNATVSQIYEKIPPKTVRELSYKITNVDSKNALIYIPFQAGKLSLPKNFVFSFEIKNPTTPNDLKKIQVAFSDGMWFQTFSDGNVIERKSYTNFDLNTKEANSFIPLGNYISTTPTSDGYIKIAIALKCTHPQDISYIILNFIKNDRMIQDVARLEGFSNGGSLSTEIRNLQIYEGEIPADNSLRPYTARKNTFSPIDFECIFSYFMHKICGVGGYFNRGLITDNGDNRSYFYDKKMAVFNPTTKVPDITTDSYNRITHIFDESLDASSENIAQKIFKFIYFLLTGLDLSSTIGDARKYKYGSKIFAAQRKSLNLFSIATDFVNLYIEDNQQIKTYTPTNPTYGEAVSKIIEIIKKYNPEYNIRYKVHNNTIVQVPQLLNSADINLALDTDIYNKRFYIVLPTDLRLYIPLGKGRYYLNNSNTSQNTYGFFYQTDSYLKNETGLDDAGTFVDIFPLNHEKLNSYAKSQNKQQIDSDTIFKRLIYSQGYLDLYKEINQSVYLTEGYFEKEITKSFNVVGVLPNVTKKTAKVWDVELADDENMSINKIDIINEKGLKVYNRGGIKFVDYDNSIYSLDNIAPLKDNKLYTKFLKIKYLNPPEKTIEASDACSISLIVKSGDLKEIISTQTTNIP